MTTPTSGPSWPLPPRPCRTARRRRHWRRSAPGCRRHPCPGGISRCQLLRRHCRPAPPRQPGRQRRRWTTSSFVGSAWRGVVTLGLTTFGAGLYRCYSKPSENEYNARACLGISILWVRTDDWLMMGDPKTFSPTETNKMNNRLDSAGSIRGGSVISRSRPLVPLLQLGF